MNASISNQAGTPTIVRRDPASPAFAGKQMPNAVQGALPELSKSRFDPATDKALNIATFEESGSLEFGNTGVTLPSTRNFASCNDDLGLMKRLAVGERITLEFRFEARNACNRVVFGSPAIGLSNPAGSGTVKGPANQPRQSQFGVKVSFEPLARGSASVFR